MEYIGLIFAAILLLWTFLKNRKQDKNEPEEKPEENPPDIPGTTEPEKPVEPEEPDTGKPEEIKPIKDKVYIVEGGVKTEGVMVRMPQGLQVFRADGTLALDITARIPKFLGVATLDGSAQSGRIKNDDLKSGDLWYLIITLNYPQPDLVQDNNTKYETPTITKEEGYLVWSFPQNRKVACKILYGVY